MALNFNTQPYHDDFDEDKNFHKILFKPGVSVQARELTQVQSILQDQIGKFGKFVLSDGSKVTGGRYFIDTNAKCLKLNDTGDLSTEIQNFKGNFVVGQTSKCIGYITETDIINYFLVVKPIVNGATNFISDEDLFIFNSKSIAIANSINSNIIPLYTTRLSSDNQVEIAGCFGEENSYEFTINSSAIEVGDVISIPSALNPYDIYVVTELVGNAKYRVNKTLDEAYVNTTLKITKFASRDVMEIGFDNGVYFTNNTFVKALSQTVVPNLKTQYPSCVVGYEVVESIVDFIDDSSLLDPAQGSYNYTAPGADRYKIYLELVYKPFVGGEIQNITSKKFIELLRIKNGIVIKDNTNPVLGELEKTLARQMYDHAGNFIVKEFNISFYDSDFKDSQQKIKAEVSPGKAYILGHEFQQSFPTFFEIDKGRDTNSKLAYESSVAYGNYIAIDKPTGILLNPQVSARIELHSTTSDLVNKNTFVAYAYVRNIRHVSDTEYHLYLYNISSSNITNVKSAVIPISSSYEALTFSSNTKLVNNKTLLIDPQFNNLLFKFPYSNIASINNVITSLDKFQTLSVVSNVISIHSGSLTTKFSSGTGILSSEEKKATFVVVTNTTNGGYAAGDYVDLSNVEIEVIITGSEYIATLTFTNEYTGQIDIKYSIDDILTDEKIKTEVVNHVKQVLAQTESTSLKIADISEFNGVFTCPQTSATYIGVWSSGITYTKDNVVLVGSELYVSLIDSNINSRPSGTSSSWSKLTNVTSNYILNNGQTEMMYDHGSIIAKSSTDVKNVFVIFNYYTHSSSGEFLYYNSYKTDYSKVPKVKIKNTSYDLKEYVDFRPRRTDNTNNIQFDNYSIPSTLFSGMQYDISYYLGRIDKLIINDSNKFQWLRGISSYKNQIPPSDISNAMTIATIEIKPFTFSQKDITISYKKHRRYTMDDIGKLDYRLNNVEYYTSLNLVEKDVMSRNIYDSVTGTRMKNGFVVDPFAGFGIMAIAENYKNCSLDLAEQALRPTFSTKYINSNVKDIKTLNEKANIISFPYTEELLISQKIATTTTNCNPFDVISYAGTLSLYPQSDIWVDVETNPVINIVNDDLAALAEALLTPGNVYDEWQSFYATHPYKLDTNPSKSSTQNGKIYDVSSTEVVKSDVIETISSNVIPYARSININFKASHLSPLTKLYMYVNGRLVNGYITPKQNPKGTLSAINILNVGSGYNANNTSVSVVAANTTIGSVNLEITGSTISGAEFSSFGLGYPTSNTIASIVSGNGANASISIITIPQLASDLYSDENGECFGMLSLPNDETLKFLSGELHLTICDNPNYEPNYSLSKAEATFYSSGRKNTLQETITSIREPYIKFMGFEPPKRTEGARIVVLDNDDYYIRNEDYDYSIYKTGTITLPVYLNKAPNSAVTVTISNASVDQSSNTNYTISPSSLTFTSADFATKKNFTLTYNLGNKLAETVDNHLFSYLEYYGSSDDNGYNFSGTKPNKVWEQSIPTDGISFTHLNPLVKRKPVPIPATISCSGISTKQETGKEEFYVLPVGEKLQEYLPITFQVVSSNNAICKVTGIYAYANTIITNSDNITISNLSEFQPFRVQVTYYATGNSSTSIVASTISGNPYWNGVTGSTTFNHISTPIEPPAPAIIIQSSTEIPRYTDEDGKTTTIGIKLSTSPVANVTISGVSSTSTEGIITHKSEDGSTIVSGNTVTFTPSNWNQTKLLIATGQADSLIDGTVVYYANLTSTSANSSWNNLNSSIAIENKDTTRIPPIIPGHIVYSYLNGVNQTSESGNTVTLLVTLDKAPLNPVVISAISNRETEGRVIANSSMLFDSSNYNVAKRVLVIGQNDSVVDGLQNYGIDFNVINTSDPAFNGVANTAPLSNIDTVIVPIIPGNIVYSYLNDISQTSESGNTVTVLVTLDKAPISGVVVTATSTDASEGIVTANSIMVFDNSNYNVAKRVLVIGQNDSIVDELQNYGIILNVTNTTDQAFSGRNITVPLSNIDNDVAQGHIVYSYLNDISQTSESGNTVTLLVTLDKAPTSNVILSAASNDESEGIVTANSTMTFTSSNYNIAKRVLITGQDDILADGLQNFGIVLNVTSTTDKAFIGVANTAAVSNVDIPEVPGTLITTLSGSPTSEAGTTATLNVKLSKAPTSNVVVAITSSDITRGQVNKANITFTLVNWNSTQDIIVTGQNDGINDQITKAYNVVLKTTSVDPLFSNIGGTDGTPVRLDNLPVYIAPVAGTLVTSFVNGAQTSEAGATATLNVKLSKAPINDVVVGITSDNTILGQVDKSSITFTSVNWNSNQVITVTGQNDGINDTISKPYDVVLKTTSVDPLFSNIGGTVGTLVPLTNLPLYIAPVAGTLVTSFVNGAQTSEAGATATLNVKLSKAPASDVLINITSDNTILGQVNKSSIIFTSVNWNSNQIITVTGQNDGINDQLSKPYNVVLKTTSDDPLFSNINGTVGTKVSLTNLPLYITKGNVKCIINGSNKTTELGGTVSLSVSLDRQPICDSVTVAVTRSDSTEADITTGSSLIFTKANWNQAQAVVVTGKDDAVVDGDQSYRVTCTATASNISIDPGYNQAFVDLINSDNDVIIPPPKIYTYSTSYSVSASVDIWLPGVFITRGIIFSDGGSSISKNGSNKDRSDHVAQASSDGTIVIRSRGWLDDDYGHDNSSISLATLGSYLSIYRNAISSGKRMQDWGFSYQDLILTPDSNSTWEKLDVLTEADQDTSHYGAFVGPMVGYPTIPAWGKARRVETLDNTKDNYRYQFNFFGAEVLDHDDQYFTRGAFPPIFGNASCGKYGWAGFATTCVTIRGILPSFKWGIQVNETVITLIDGVAQPPVTNVVWSWAAGANFGTGLLNNAAFTELSKYFKRIHNGSENRLWHFGVSNLIQSTIIVNATKSEINALIAAQTATVTSAQRTYEASNPKNASDYTFWQMQLSVLAHYQAKLLLATTQ